MHSRVLPVGVRGRDKSPKAVLLIVRNAAASGDRKTSHQACNHQVSPYGADVVTDRCADLAAPRCLWALCCCLHHNGVSEMSRGLVRSQLWQLAAMLLWHVCGEGVGGIGTVTTCKDHGHQDLWFYWEWQMSVVVVHWWALLSIAPWVRGFSSRSLPALPVSSWVLFTYSRWTEDLNDHSIVLN